jgi:hypothetical protein
MAELTADLRLPTVYAARDHVAAGGLISYGVSLQDNARRLGVSDFQLWPYSDLASRPPLVRNAGKSRRAAPCI